MRRMKKRTVKEEDESKNERDDGGEQHCWMKVDLLSTSMLLSMFLMSKKFVVLLK